MRCVDAVLRSSLTIFFLDSWVPDSTFFIVSCSLPLDSTVTLAVPRLRDRSPQSLYSSFMLFETRSLPTLTRSYPRRFTFYVADPSAPLKLVRCPRLGRR